MHTLPQQVNHDRVISGKKRYYILLLTFIFAFVLGGCSNKPPHPRWLWPAPPQQPRLEFIRTFNSQAELQPNIKRRKLNALTNSRQEPEIYFPFGLSSVDDENILVSDQDKRLLRLYNLKTASVQELTGPNHLEGPLDLAHHSNGTIYLVDKHKILQLSPQGLVLSVFGKDKLNNPAYIEVNETLNRLYISDSTANQVHAFDISGDWLFSFGHKGKDPGGFLGPQGLAIDEKGQIFIADFFNARVQVFTAEGKFIRTFGQRGSGSGDFEGPKDLAFDSEGHLHIVDSRKNALLTYSPDGDLLLFTGGGPGTAHPLGFRAPSTIHIDKNDRIYISDRLNHRVSIWQYLNPAYLKKHPITPQDIEHLKKFTTP